MIAVTREQVASLVQVGAGVGSGAVMRLAPDVVMPSEEVIEGCRAVIDEFLAANPEGGIGAVDEAESTLLGAQNRGLPLPPVDVAVALALIGCGRQLEAIAVVLEKLTRPEDAA